MVIYTFDDLQHEVASRQVNKSHQNDVDWPGSFHFHTGDFGDFFRVDGTLHLGRR